MSAVAAQAQADGKKYEKGATVTLQGCVVAAEKKDTYVLTNVREWPIANSDMGKFGKRYYWIDKAGKDMKAHLGHTIQLIGKITDVDEVRDRIQGRRERHGPERRDRRPRQGRRDAGRECRGEAGRAVPNKNDIPITLLKLKVDEIKMTSSTCTSTMYQ